MQKSQNDAFIRLSDREFFFRFFKKNVKQLALAVRLPIDVDEGILADIHAQWLERRDYWLNDLMPEGTFELSHIKECAILIHLSAMSEVCCVTTTSRNANGDEVLIPGDKGFSNNSYTEFQRNKIVKHQSRYICWQIFYALAETIQKTRNDSLRIDFSKITPGLEDNMFEFMEREEVNDAGLYLMLGAMLSL